jgi:hypothetical protein
MTVSEALLHEYLTTGSIHKQPQQPSNTELSTDNNDYDHVSGDDDGVRVRPQDFHLHEPVALPKGESQLQQEDDQLWARRQFSVLWAPMPSDAINSENAAVSR